MTDQAPTNGEQQAVEPCPFEHNLTLDRTVETWGLGRCCLGCGLPVRLVVEHCHPNPLGDLGHFGAIPIIPDDPPSNARCEHEFVRSLDPHQEGLRCNFCGQPPSAARTGAERYFDEQLADPEYREAYEAARHDPPNDGKFYGGRP